MAEDLAVGKLVVRHLGLRSYEGVWREMEAFTDKRDKQSHDELWLLEHEAVFTLGQAGKKEHILFAGDIPVVNTDRGGQVTYHGPGQIVAYLLFDIRRLGINVRQLVSGIETCLIELLRSYKIDAHGRSDAPGVYVGEKKIAALGLRIRRGCSFHGLSLNVDMDIEPFTRINPCGYQGLEIAQLNEFGISDDIGAVSQKLLHHIVKHFGYTSLIETDV